MFSRLNADENVNSRINLNFIGAFHTNTLIRHCNIVYRDGDYATTVKKLNKT